MSDEDARKPKLVHDSETEQSTLTPEQLKQIEQDERELQGDHARSAGLLPRLRWQPARSRSE